MLAHEFGWSPGQVVNLDPHYVEELLRFIGARNRLRSEEDKATKDKLAKVEKDAESRRNKQELRNRGGRPGTPPPAGAGKFKRKVHQVNQKG